MQKYQDAYRPRTFEVIPNSAKCGNLIDWCRQKHNKMAEGEERVATFWFTVWGRKLKKKMKNLVSDKKTGQKSASIRRIRKYELKALNRTSQETRCTRLECANRYRGAGLICLTTGWNFRWFRMDDNTKALALQLLSPLCDLEELCLHRYAWIVAQALSRQRFKMRHRMA